MATSRSIPVTPFAVFVRRIGARSIVLTLSRDYHLPMTQRSVYRWLTGARTPRPVFARAVVSLSHGALTLDDVYRHSEEARKNERHPEGTAGRALSVACPKA